MSDNICIHHTDAERDACRIGCPICLSKRLAAVTADLEFRRQLGALQQQEYDKVTAERDVLRADLCTFAVDMEKQLTAVTAERDTARATCQELVTDSTAATLAETVVRVTAERDVLKAANDAVADAVHYELRSVTAERDVLKADLCAFAVDMERQLSAVTAERDTKQMEYSRAQEMASKFCAQRDEARAERDKGGWYQAGLSIATQLALAGINTDGIVEGVVKLQSERDTALDKLDKAQQEARRLSKIADALLNHCDKEGGECSECGRIVCPHGEPLHFHHDGCDLIRAERARQMEREGWGPEHDDSHTDGSLAKAAACYAQSSIVYQDRDPNEPAHLMCGYPGPDSLTWPWEVSGWKPSPQERIRELVKAGALIAAEIDRLYRERRKQP